MKELSEGDTHAHMKISFSNGYSIEDPEARIRKYCSIDVYHGYDDRHNINDRIEWQDIAAADNLYANIMRFWAPAADKLVCSDRIPKLLNEIDNIELGTLQGEEWRSMRRKIFRLLQEFMGIRGVGMAISTKILHLKRPKLFPILDSYVMKFLLGVDTVSLKKNRILDYGRTAFEKARKDLLNNEEQFNKLEEQTRDLPINLEKVRMYDILCWSIEKWDIRREINTTS